MSFITKRQLRELGRGVTRWQERLAKSLDNKNLFLSHSHRDNELVLGAMTLLERAGASVYVDLHDEELSKLDMDERVRRVRAAVLQCKRTVVLFSANSHTSRWIPWELALGDARRGINTVATLPAGDTTAIETWGTQEYFGIYPQVRFGARGGAPPEYLVRDPADGTHWTLSQWIRG